MTKARKTNLFFLGLLVFYLLVCNFILPLIPNRYVNVNSLGVLSQTLILFPGMIYAFSDHGRVLNQIRVKRLGIENIFLIMVFALLLVPLMAFVNSFSMLFAKNHMATHLNSMSSNPFWLNLLLIAVLPAFVEEFTFRGIIYTGYRNSTMKRAILASAVIFGTFHMNVNQFCYAAVMGVFFSLLYEATGSIFASMTAHFTLNANTLVLQAIADATTKYIRTKAESDPDYEKLAEELTNSETQTTIADYSLAEKIATLRSLLVIAAVTTTLAILLLIFISKRFHRKEHFSRVLSSLTGNDRNQNLNNGYENISIHMQNNEKNNGVNNGYNHQMGYNGSPEYGGKIVDAVFITGIVLCIFCML